MRFPWWRRRREADLEDEIQSHLKMAARDRIGRGESATEAERSVRREFGGVSLVKEVTRDMWGWGWLEDLLQDVRYGARTLVKSPGFAIVAVLTLSLGIAVNATMFSLVSAFLLQRPPGREPDRVAVVTSVDPAQGMQPDTNPISAANYLAWREANHVFVEMAATQYRTINLNSKGQTGEAGQPEVLRSTAVSPNYFTVLGVSPELGRPFSDGEDQPGRDHVVVLSQDLWRRHFGSDASLVGRTIRLNREDYTVVGVMPASFRMLGFAPQLWTPLVLTTADQTAAARKNRSLTLFGRLKPGVTLEQARAEMATLARRAGEAFPETEKGWGAAVRTLPDFLAYVFGNRTGLAVIMTTVGFVLMIACANVAGLLLARSTGRRRELAIRIALGAGRLRIIRQLLTEGMVIAILGGGIGVLFAYWGIHFVRASMTTFNQAMSGVLSLDWHVLLYALGASLVCAVLCGLAPSLKASRTDINANLQSEGRAASPTRSHIRLRTVMVTSEIALALFLLVGTGLLFRGTYLIEHQNLGFRPEHMLTANVTLDAARYKDAAQQSLFVRDLIPRLQHIPGTEAVAVAVASDLPANRAGSVTFQIKGQPELAENEQVTASDVIVTADYFGAAGIPLLRGRTFTEMDNATAPRVVLVNQEFVHSFMQDHNPLGKQIRLDVNGAPEWREIVGVVGNVKWYSQMTREDPEIYEAFHQRPVPSISLMVRATSDPNSLASSMRNAVAQVDAELPIARMMSMPAVIDLQKGGNVFFARVLGSFALLALILSAIGVYGLIAYSVGQRTHEIGIRMALGARSLDVLRMILWDGMKMTASGAAIGLAMALPLPKVFDAMFYGLQVRDPRLYFVLPVVILAVAMLATYIPARRATRADPTSALRQE